MLNTIDSGVEIMEINSGHECICGNETGTAKNVYDELITQIAADAV